jgi:hypothetical protein
VLVISNIDDNILFSNKHCLNTRGLLIELSESFAFSIETESLAGFGHKSESESLEGFGFGFGTKPTFKKVFRAPLNPALYSYS